MLRRLDGRHVVPTPEILDKCSEIVRKWSPLANHPNLVGFRDAFVSEEMLSVPSLNLTYDYHHASCSLEQIYIVPSQGGHKSRLSEEELWSYLVQMTAALRAVHSAGLDLGPSRLAPSKVLLCSPGRLRIGSLGVEEILHGSTSPMDMMTSQLLDLEALGHLILTLATAVKNMAPTLDNLILHYSRELCHIVAGLIAAPKGNGFQNWKSLAVALGDRVFDELGTSLENVDTLAMGMLKECENGRIARFLIKLNAVVDRAELLGDTRWAETGDRYLLKLFRDFIFHQVDDQGLPINDWGIIIDAINKADSGIDEKIMLLSRDEASMLVVSYADIKRCLVSAYEEIKRNSATVK
jgi:PAB-dependent poly(A)-specific ribonuclease subunit 3